MGLSENELCPVGASRFHPVVSSSSQEGGSVYKRSSQSERTHWPTIIIELGLSESLHYIRSSAEWWLENSNAQVSIVALIAIKPADKRLRACSTRSKQSSH
jgi:hypothetical protein